jgi:hypothetical protein
MKRLDGKACPIRWLQSGAKYSFDYYQRKGKQQKRIWSLASFTTEVSL